MVSSAAPEVSEAAPESAYEATPASVSNESSNILSVQEEQSYFAALKSDDDCTIEAPLGGNGSTNKLPLVIRTDRQQEEISFHNSFHNPPARQETGRNFFSSITASFSGIGSNDTADKGLNRGKSRKNGIGKSFNYDTNRSFLSFDSQSFDDDNGIENYTAKDIRHLKRTMHDITFDNLDSVIPWTPEMELDAKSEGGDHEFATFEVKPEEPLNDAELAFIRKFVRKGRQNRVFDDDDDETMPLKFDEEGRPVPLSSYESGPRGKALRKIKNQESNYTTKLAEDSFSFLISANVCSAPFIFSAAVFTIKVALFALICINLIDRNDEDNPLGIPAGITPPVAIAQFLAMFIAVASQDDIRTSLNYFYEGYDNRHLGSAFAGAAYWKWLISVWLHFFEGALGLSTTFLLIVTSDEVVNLILDFTAIEFITLLDNAAYILAQQGFMGRQNKLESEIVAITEYSIPKWRKRTPSRQIITLFSTFLILVIGWIVVYTRQMQGIYTPQSLVVQFDDDLRPELGAYSGIYNLEIQKGFSLSRIAYKAVNGNGHIGYCSGPQFWTFSTDGTNPCSDYVVKSSQATSFDITDAADDKWFATEDSDLQRFFPMENFLLELGCDRDRDCGGVGRGVCEDHQCVCNDGLYGIRCDYAADEACDTIVVDERRDIFQASRSYATTYQLLRNSNGDLVQVYHHPVFVAEAGLEGGLDVLMYAGARWILTHSVDGLPQLESQTYEGLADYLSSVQFHAVEHLSSLAFFTEPVIFNSPDDGDSPVGISWFAVLEESLSNTERVGTVNTLMLCSVCNDEDNPCQNGNPCGGDGQCLCENGASGSLCQITPLNNGHCDTVFNTASYKYDGGDCCQATCISALEQTCGVASIGTLLAVDEGYPHCIDPAVVTSCDSESCWAPTSRYSDDIFATEGLTGLTSLSANGRILAAATPDVDVVAVFDQEDSRWIQRGPLLEGKRGSKFGKAMALSTLPGAVVGRRYGKVPVLLAIGIHGLSEAGVRVVRWEPNDLDWRAVGNVINICTLFSADCDLLAIDIGREGDRVSLAVVRSDSVVLLYRTTLTETGFQNWDLDYVALGNGEQLENGVYKGASLSGKSNVLALTRGNFLEVYFPPDSGTIEEDLLGGASEVKRYVVDMKQEVNLIQTFFGYNNTVSPVASVTSVKMAADESSLLVFCEGEAAVDYVIRYIVSPSRPPLANIFRNFTTSTLSDSEIESGLSLVRFSADASSMAVRVNTTDGPRVRLVSYNGTSQNFDPVGAQFTEIQEELRSNAPLGNDFIDERGDFSLSYDAGAYLQVGTSGPEGYGIVPRCTSAAEHYRMSIILDENPSFVSWSIQTYQTLGELTFRNRIVRDCDNCYFDDDRFGRGVVAEDVCVQTNYDPCLRVNFQSDFGLQAGAGLVVFKEGTELTRYEEGSTDLFTYISNPGSADECEIPKAVCSESEVHIIVEMNLDDFSSSDNSWKLTNGNDETLLEGGNYTSGDDRATFLLQVCAPANETFTFSLLDGNPSEDFSNGNGDPDKYRIDGLCCDWGKGGYRIFVDSQEVHALQGERDFRLEQVVFDGSGEVVVKTVPVTFELQTDMYPDEVIWWFESPDASEVWWWRDYQATQVAPNSYIRETVYLPEGGIYYLVVWDRFGDGFCCGDTGNGFYNLYWGTEVDPSKQIVIGDADFGGITNFKDHLIEVLESSILSPTTLAPTSLPPVAAPISAAPVAPSIMAPVDL